MQTPPRPDVLMALLFLSSFSGPCLGCFRLPRGFSHFQRLEVHSQGPGGFGSWGGLAGATFPPAESREVIALMPLS